jgi:hypothetical protein
VPNCIYSEVMGGYNEWKIIKISEGTGTEDAKEDLEELYEDVLGAIEARSAREIHADSFGAYLTVNDDYHIVKWTGEAFPLNVDDAEVEGATGPLPIGTLVARGSYCYTVKGAKDWYTEKLQNPQEKPAVLLFRVRYVVATNLVMEPPGARPEVRLPRNRGGQQWRDEVQALGARKLAESSIDEIQAEIARRALLDYEEGGIHDPAELDVDEDDDSSSGGGDLDTVDEDSVEESSEEEE